MQFNLKHLLMVVVPLAMGVAYFTTSIRNAEREHASFEKLCELGATGDDWVSFKEFITGRPPIVQLAIPSTVRTSLAVELLPDLGNLESLSVALDSPSNSDLDVIRDMGLRSLHFCGTFPREEEIGRLARFGRLEFLYLKQKNQLSDGAVDRLKRQLPNTRIELR